MLVFHPLSLTRAPSTASLNPEPRTLNPQSLQIAKRTHLSLSRNPRRKGLNKAAKRTRLGIEKALKRGRKGGALGALLFSNSCRNPAQPTPPPPLASNTSKHRRSNYSFPHSALGHWDLVILWTLGLGHSHPHPIKMHNKQPTTNNQHRVPSPHPRSSRL